jgi:hypothetical protein
MASMPCPPAEREFVRIQNVFFEYKMGGLLAY